jgi:uncharacterized protein DUF1592/uncharacterized protein DUF1588/uncharacterized protein DUF1587/uncharacterized protein DUF1585/uncharacterized protein DUF1595/cytochrome c
MKNLRSGRNIVWVGVIALATMVSLQARSPGRSSPAGPVTRGAAESGPMNAAEFKPVIQRYCLTCHNQQAKAPGLTLDTADLARPSANADIWEKAIRALRNRTMPPPGSPRPDEATFDRLAESLERSIDAAASAHPNPGHIPSLHRLNRAEYVNAIRDLLAIDVDEQQLPPDDSGFGFDNIADVLSVSPMLMERYLSAASKISRVAVGDPSIKPTFETFNVGKYVRQDERLSESLPFASRGGLVIHHYFPVDADYVAKIFFDRIYDNSRVRGLGELNQLEVRLNGVKIQDLTIGVAAPTQANDDPALPSEETLRGVNIDGLEVRFTAKAGPADLAVSFVKKAAETEGMLRPAYAITSYEYAADIAGPAGIRTVELRGPYDVKGSGNSPSRQRLFVCRPSNTRSEDACARQIFSTFTRRAYRRPVSDIDLQPLIDSFKERRAQGAFDGGIAAAVRLVLVSPDFLFRIEQNPNAAKPGVPYRISDVELASRLSFFLWSSIPDDQLLDAAVKGQLSKPDVLTQQVKRMLNDPRASALVKNFAGQWLYLRNIRLSAVDPSVFPDFDDNLRAALARELELFLDSQVREDHGIPELLTADYTFLNERLAKHYGIPAVYGDHFRRVTLTDDYRKGLLGKGGLLMVTSYPNRTSPVKRGKFLLESLLGTPPPPAPPDVPALNEVAARDKPRTMRERMETHRVNPGCASCHRLMDPLGFALDNFDAVGRWRTNDGGVPIDASGVLADGTAVDGPATLGAALLSHRERFAQTVCEKLLTYALGRGVDWYDGPAVRQIVRRAALSEYRWSAIILGIVRSAAFQTRMPPETSAPRLTAASR